MIPDQLCLRCLAPAVALDAEDECPACAAEFEAWVAPRIAEQRAVEAHRAAVLTEAARTEPPGRIPLDDVLGR